MKIHLRKVPRTFNEKNNILFCKMVTTELWYTSDLQFGKNALFLESNKKIKLQTSNKNLKVISTSFCLKVYFKAKKGAKRTCLLKRNIIHELFLTFS